MCSVFHVVRVASRQCTVCDVHHTHYTLHVHGHVRVACCMSLYVGCAYKMYGCCPDGKTEAKGWSFRGCPGKLDRPLGLLRGRFVSSQS